MNHKEESTLQAYDTKRIKTDTRTWRAYDWYQAGWDAARTFTAEDVEQAHAALIRSTGGGNTPFDLLAMARAALDAVGTVNA